MRVEPLRVMIFIDCAMSGVDHDFEPGVEILGVLAEDDEVDVGVVRLEARQALDGTEVRVKVELLAQGYVDRGRNLRRWVSSRGP